MVLERGFPFPAARTALQRLWRTRHEGRRGKTSPCAPRGVSNGWSHRGAETHSARGNGVSVAPRGNAMDAHVDERRDEPEATADDMRTAEDAGTADDVGTTEDTGTADDVGTAAQRAEDNLPTFAPPRDTTDAHVDRQQDKATGMADDVGSTHHDQSAADQVLSPPPPPHRCCLFRPDVGQPRDTDF